MQAEYVYQKRGLGNLLHLMDSSQRGGGGYLGFLVMGMIEGSQKSRSKKIPMASIQQNTKKSLNQKLTPKKSHAVLYFQNYVARALMILFNTVKKSLLKSS